MLAPLNIKSYAQVCAAIGDEVAEPGGFVPVRSLLSRFRAQLIVRPLLVEAMLSTVSKTPSGQSWAVLVDSEKYPITEQDLREECSARPLHQRLRNSIAHELVHSLAFRATEFGIDLLGNSCDAANRDALVKAIERETERLSPLLLWPETALSRLVTESKELLGVETLGKERARLGVSRPVLVNRFQLLGFGGDKGPGYYKSLQNLGIGTGEWIEGGRAVLHRWPVFVNFHRNIVPDLFLRLAGQDRTPAGTLFTDREFSLCGGARDTTDFETAAGTPNSPSAEKMTIHCEIERSSRKIGSAFLYVVRKSGNP